MKFPILTCLCAAMLGAQTEYHGRFLPELRAAPYFGQENLQIASTDDLARLPRPLDPRESAYASAITWTAEAPLRLLLVEEAGQAPFLYVDANLDGRFSDDERVALSSEPRHIDVPIASAPFRAYPLLVQLPPREGIAPSRSVRSV
ncbi:MAG: hypothetical protein ACRD9L_21225, partial [Bryobacteraceae bacterium]